MFKRACVSDEGHDRTVYFICSDDCIRMDLPWVALALGFYLLENKNLDAAITSGQ